MAARPHVETATLGFQGHSEKITCSLSIGVPFINDCYEKGDDTVVYAQPGLPPGLGHGWPGSLSHASTFCFFQFAAQVDSRRCGFCRPSLRHHAVYPWAGELCGNRFAAPRFCCRVAFPAATTSIGSVFFVRLSLLPLPRSAPRVVSLLDYQTAVRDHPAIVGSFIPRTVPF